MSFRVSSVCFRRLDRMFLFDWWRIVGVRTCALVPFAALLACHLKKVKNYCQQLLVLWQEMMKAQRSQHKN